MRKIHYLLAPLIISSLLAGCDSSPENRFAAAEQFPAATAKPGLTLSACEYEKDDITYAADCGVLLVPENRNKPDSRLIPLPVRRIYSNNPNKQEPVFELFGGPGLQNVSTRVPEKILANQDFVQVGYRGADGVTRMDCPEIGAAMMDTERAFSEQAALRMKNGSVNCLKRMQAEGFDLSGYNIVEVVEDIETARKALGYSQVVLKSGSYGTRLALLYAHMYPQSIIRSMVSAVNPPGGMVWSPQLVDLKLQQFAHLCQQDSYCNSRTDDLLQSLRNAFKQVPSYWLNIAIDPDKVKVALFNGLYQTEMAAASFDMIIDAENGDYSGFAMMSFAYDFMFAGSLIWGDNMLKAATADFTREVEAKDYSDKNSVIGSPMMQLGLPMWQALRELNIPMIPEKYRSALSSDVTTLAINGDLDVATPVEVLKERQMPYLSNATLVIIEHAGHQDAVPGFYKFRNQFMANGKIDHSLLKTRAMSFEPSVGFSTIAKLAVAALVVLPLLLIGLVIFLVKRYQKRQERKASLISKD
jgi:pimeloyl-ACP methyl ester carboxylesterase